MLVRFAHSTLNWLAQITSASSQNEHFTLTSYQQCVLISRLRPPCVAIYGAARGWAKIRKKIDKNLNSATFFLTIIPVHLHLKKRSTYKSAGNGPIFGDLPAGGGWCGPGLVRAVKGKKKALA